MSIKCRAKNPANCAYHGSPLNFSTQSLKRDIRENEAVITMWGDRSFQEPNTGIAEVDDFHNESFEAAKKRPVLQLRLDAKDAQSVEALEQKAKIALDIVQARAAGFDDDSPAALRLSFDDPDLYYKTRNEIRDLKYAHEEIDTQAKLARNYHGFKTQVQKSITELKASQSEVVPEGIKNRAVLRIVEAQIFAHRTAADDCDEKYNSLPAAAIFTSNPAYAERKALESSALAHKAILVDLVKLKEEVDENTFVPTRVLKEYFSV